MASFYHHAGYRGLETRGKMRMHRNLEVVISIPGLSLKSATEQLVVPPAAGIMGIVLGLIDPVSVHCNWVGYTLQSPTCVAAHSEKSTC